MQQKRIAQSPKVDVQQLELQLQNLVELMQTLSNVEKRLDEQKSAVASRILQFVQLYQEVVSSIEKLTRLGINDVAYTQHYLEPVLEKFEAVGNAQKRVESPSFQKSVSALLPGQSWGAMLERSIIGFFQSVPKLSIDLNEKKVELEKESKELTKVTESAMNVESCDVSPLVMQMREVEITMRERSKSLGSADAASAVSIAQLRDSHSQLDLRRRSLSTQYRHFRYDAFSQLEVAWISALAQSVSCGPIAVWDPARLKSITESTFGEGNRLQVEGLSFDKITIIRRSDILYQPQIEFMSALLTSADHLCHLASTTDMVAQFLNRLTDEQKRVMYTPTKEVSWWVRLQILCRPKDEQVQVFQFFVDVMNQAKDKRLYAVCHILVDALSAVGSLIREIDPALKREVDSCFEEFSKDSNAFLIKNQEAASLPDLALYATVADRSRGKVSGIFFELAALVRYVGHLQTIHQSESTLRLAVLPPVPVRETHQMGLDQLGIDPKEWQDFKGRFLEILQADKRPQQARSFGSWIRQE